MLRRVPVHPVLVAAFPVLLLWGQNGAEVPPGDALTVLGLVVAATLGVAALAAALLRDARRGALVASAIGAVVLAHGHLWGLGSDARVLPGLPVAALLMGLAVIRVRALEDEPAQRLTGIANVVAGVLVLALLPIVGSATRGALAGAAAAAETADDGDGAVAAGGRDVVWIVPDRHGSAAGLEHTFGLDTSDFTAALEERGFSVADDARTNYPKTQLALAAALNLDDLEDLAAEVPAAARDSLAAADALLADSLVVDRLDAAGYEYIHLGSWWGPSADAPRADVVLTLGAGSGVASEFAGVFLGTTLLDAVGVGGEGRTHRDRHRRHAEWQFEQLDAVAERLVTEPSDTPRFVFVHLLLPHEPYVFDRDGSLVTPDVQRSRTRAENYERQLDYLHERLLAVLDTLASAPDDREPIVLLQADEGPHPARVELGDPDEFTWGEATDAELVTKFSILSALRVPGEDVELPERVTAVNVARVLLDEVLGTSTPPLPDRSYIHPTDDDYYTYVDVTARLDDPTG